MRRQIAALFRPSMVRAVAAIGCAVMASGCGDAKTGKQGFACREMKPEVSALEGQYANAVAANAKTAAFVQASKDMVWASETLEHDVADACQRIGTDLGLSKEEMKEDKGPGGFASGICNAVSKRFDLIQRTQGLRTWITVAEPACIPNQNAWGRCGTVCNIADPQCKLMCNVHANVHADCEQTQVRVRRARNGNVPPEIMSTLSANLTSLVHAQVAIGQRLAADVAALNQIAALMPQVVGNAGSDAKECIGAGGEGAKDAARRMRVSERAAADLLARVQGR